jgi:TolB-like protein/cytochrome c-type biogenesis protein CcmH/NrfG
VIGRTISHYRIDRRLGAGGMGEVYLACDLALGRAAALKVLPEKLDASLAPRLLREAEACARLQHPAIATFYEAGESDGVVFLAMEYVPGQTLRDRLVEGPLPYRQAVALTAWLLEALGHAHAAGILHRDIKPENVMVTGESSAKLLDFGIAKMFLSETSPDEPTAAAQTADGEILGTVGYMSPEQLKGLALDARSDLFSVGAVLYEALSGERAFPGRTAGERMAAILSKDPNPLRVAGAPAELHALLSRALAREPSLRYPTAAAFLSDLRHVAAGEFIAAMPDTLAVMDFENLSRNPDDDWIGSGVAESVAAELARVPGLSVVAREKAIKVRKSLGEAADALDLGHALGCRWVLSGSYQRMGPALRMTSRLVETSTGRAVATEKLDGRLEEIFPMQDRLASSTAAVLNLTLPASIDTPAPRSLDAYESHARGRRLFHELGKGTFDQARELFEQAIAADPEHAPALAGLSAIHAMRFTFTTDPVELDRAVGYAERSIAADANLGEPHIWLGYALWRQWKTEEALREERRAMELAPDSPFGPYFAGWCQISAGDPAGALPLFQRAIEVDPQHGWSWLGVGFSHAELGHFSEARWSLEKAVALEKKLPQSPTVGVSGYLGECLRRMGDPAAARARCLEGLEATEKSDHMYRDTFRAICLCVLGRAALDQEDVPAARVAFAQAVAHLRGRPRALGGGHLLAQALAGLSRAEEGPKPYEEASRIFENRRGFDFSYLWCCSDDVTLYELSRAAGAIGRTEEASSLLEKARAAGRGTLAVES